MSDSSQTGSSVYQAYAGNTYLFGGNAPYVEEMYENYLANPGSVPDSWRQYFDALQHVPAVDGSNAKDVPHLPVVNAFAERAKQGGPRLLIALSLIHFRTRTPIKGGKFHVATHPFKTILFLMFYFFLLCDVFSCLLIALFFLQVMETPQIYTVLFVGSVSGVLETDVSM